MDTTDLDLIISRLKDTNQSVRGAALNALHGTVRTSQGASFTEIQNLLDRIDAIAGALECFTGEEYKLLNDLLSVISVIGSQEDLLRYRLAGGATDLSEWSHQYVARLVAAIVDVSSGRTPQVDYSSLVEPIIAFLFAHNSEAEAIDFAIEVSGIPQLSTFSAETSTFVNEIKTVLGGDTEATPSETDTPQPAPVSHTIGTAVFDLIAARVDPDNRDRVLPYLEELARFYDLTDLLLAVNRHDPTRYLVALIRHHRLSDAIAHVKSLTDPLEKRQCLYILARCSIQYPGSTPQETRILTNSHMAGVFHEVATALEVLPPKRVEYLFKGLNKEKVDVAAVANSLIHFAFGRDPLFFPQPGDYQPKEEHLQLVLTSNTTCCVASTGLLHAFDPSKLYSIFESRIFSSPEIGPVLALALSSYRSGDPNSEVLNLLSLFLTSTPTDTIAALMGITLLYSSTHRQEIYDLTFPLLSSPDNNVALFTIYTLGCVFPGDIEILDSCIEVFGELKKDPLFTNFALLGLASFFYRLSPTPGSDVARALDRLTPHARVLARGFMALGTGDPRVVDAILAEAFIGDIDTLLESLGLLAVCMVAAGDPVAIQLVERITTSSLMLDSPHLRSIVPFCLALLHPSSPRPEVIDTLERSINSGECSVNAIIAIGLVGAGSCSSRILRIFDANFGSLYKDPRASAALVYARGLICLGKGLFSLSPICYDRQILLPRNYISLLSTLFLFLDGSCASFKDYSYLLLLITGAVTPRYVHFDRLDSSEKVNSSEKAGNNDRTNNSSPTTSPTELTIRVGKPVDVVGMAGKPNKLSAVVVHSLPAILNGDERAESEIPVVTSYIEDILVFRNNVN